MLPQTRISAGIIYIQQNDKYNQGYVKGTISFNHFHVLTKKNPSSCYTLQKFTHILNPYKLFTTPTGWRILLTQITIYTLSIIGML